MKKIGDYDWSQVSKWEFTPDNCIEKLVNVGKVTCCFYLTRTTKIISDNHSKFEVVTSLDGVPSEVLNWRNSTFNVKRGNDGNI